MKQIIIKLIGYYGKAFGWCVSGVAKIWKHDYNEQGTLKPWLNRQHKSLRILLGIPVFFFDFFINMIKLVFYIILVLFMISAPFILLSYLIRGIIFIIR